MQGLDEASIKAALAGETSEPSGKEDIDPVTAAGRRLMQSRGWKRQDIEDLMAMIEGAREGD